jgi:hypothetical protein
MSYFVNTHLGAAGPPNLPLEDDEFPRGFRIIDPNQSPPQIGIGFTDPLEAGQTVVERLPLGLMVQEAEAIYVIVTDPNDPNFTVEKVTLSLPPSYVDNGKQVQEFAADGAVAITYLISGPLEPGQIIDGVVVGGDSPGLIHGLSFETDDSVLEQLEALQQEIFSGINRIMCTAFQVIPGILGQEVKIDRECNNGPRPPAVISFDDSQGPFSLTKTNKGKSKLSVAVGAVEADACNNLVGQFYMGNTVTFAIRGEFWVGEAFTIDALDPNNDGKKAKATVTIKGGNTSANPHGYEGQMEAWSVNLNPPPPFPPVIYPSMGVVSDRIEAQFLSGSTVSDSFLLEQSDLINAEFASASTAEPFSCDCDKAEPEGDYEKEFEVELRDGGALPGPDYLMRIFGCNAAITVGSAATTYKYWGDCAGNTLCGNTYSCVLPPPHPIWGAMCYWAMANPETRDNQRKGLRFEEVSIDFHHIDLRVQSVEIDDSTPLEGVFANIIVTICNEGDPKSDPEWVLVKLTDKRTGLFWGWVLDGPDPNECIKWTFPWDTAGLAGTGVRDLCVWVESVDVAELDYTDNEGCIQVEVQPSIKAAFVSTCNPSQVQLWDTRTRLPISSCDIASQTQMLNATVEGIDVPSSGKYAWVVLTYGGYDALGIDVQSCWSGPCQVVAQPTLRPGPVNGSIAVDSAGQLAFVPGHTGSRESFIHILSLGGSGAQYKTDLNPPDYEVTFLYESETTIAAATTSRGVREVYIAGRDQAPYGGGYVEEIYSIVLPPPPPEGIVTPLPNPFDLCLDYYEFSVPQGKTSNAAGVVFTKDPNAKPNGRVVLTDIGSGEGQFFTFETGTCSDTGCWGPTDANECKDVNTRGVVPCLAGQVLVPPIPIAGNNLLDVIATREGGFAYALDQRSGLWRHALPLDSNANTPEGSPIRVTPTYPVRYVDLAITPPTSPDGQTGQDVWVADEVSCPLGIGEIDIFGALNATYMQSVPLVQGAPISITIAPIPLSGQVSIFPGPLPIPFPFPIQWPPDVDRDYDFVTLSPVADEFVGKTLLPVINCLPEPAPFHLEFLNLPDGWTVVWDAPLLHFVQPFEGEMENIVFAPVEFRTPIAPNEPVGLRVRAWSPEGGEPNDFAVTLLRADITTCGDLRHPFPAGDLNWDCRVDFEDFAVLAMNWPELFNWATLQKLADSWLACTHPFECPSSAGTDLY